MTYYIYMIAPNYGKEPSCWRRDIRKLLTDAGYDIVSFIGKFIKVDTATKKVFGCSFAPGVYFDERTSWSVLRNTF